MPIASLLVRAFVFSLFLGPYTLFVCRSRCIFVRDFFVCNVFLCMCRAFCLCGSVVVGVVLQGVYS